MAFLTETKTSRQSAKPVSRRLMIAVRIKPLDDYEMGRCIHGVDDQVVVLEENEIYKNDVLRQNRRGDRQYTFDAVFGEDTPQETIYEITTKSLVKEVLEGYNATIFAYGASGSGKTHTMLGTTAEPGIMIRALSEIFTFIKSSGLQQHYHVSMSYLEIYNENIRDLLNPSSGFLELREDQREKTIHVVKLSEVSTSSTEEMIQLLQRGNKARTIEPTTLNKTSSRSHALLSVTVRQTLPFQTTEKLKARIKQGKLFMIDLAGSERASQTKNQGKRLVEGAHINRSLLALGNCINALSGGARYVNYRDSKLTRLLKDALSGNSQTFMIAHVSPAAVNREESKNTLLYAQRAKSISNKVERNILDISYHVSQYRTIISELRDEIARLKSKIPEEEKIFQKLNTTDNYKETASNDQLDFSDSYVSALKNEIVETFREQMKLRKRLLNIESYLMELDVEANRQQSIIHDCEGRGIYRADIYSGKMPRQPDLGSLDLDYQDIEKESQKSFDKAFIELALIEKEQEKYLELKAVTEVELEKCKEKALLLEKELPLEINSQDEKELLSLLIRVHELEVEKITLQTERMTREHALRQRDIAIERYVRQKQIYQEIIRRQREIIEEEKLPLPSDLQQLYQVYQQEHHLYSSPDHNLNEVLDSKKLPPIGKRRLTSYSRVQKLENGENGLEDSDNSTRTPSSSAGSDWVTSPLPPISRRGFGSFSSNIPMPSATILFPPISKPYPEFRFPTVKETMKRTCENIEASGDNPFDSTYYPSQKIVDQRILQMLSETLDLNITVIRNPLVTDLETYKRNPDSWVIEQIVNGSAEISSTSLILAPDLKGLKNFTHAIGTFRPQLYYKAKSLREIYNIYLIPFSPELWVSLVIAVVFLTLALILILSRESKLPHKISYDVVARIIDVQQDKDEEWSDEIKKTPAEFLIRKEKWETGEILLSCLGALCQQGSARDPSTNAARMLVLVLFLVAVVGYTAYSASVISLISLFPSTERELIRDITFFSDKYKILLYNIKNFKNLQVNFNETEFTNLRTGFDRALKGEAGFIGDRDVSLTFFHQQNYKSNLKCTLGRVFLGVEYQRVFGLKNNSKYKEKFNYNILRLKQSGLIQREKKRIFNTKLPCTSAERSISSNFISFNKNDMEPVLKLFKVGLFTSFLLLMAENIVFHCSTKKTKVSLNE